MSRKTSRKTDPAAVGGSPAVVPPVKVADLVAAMKGDLTVRLGGRGLQRTIRDEKVQRVTLPPDRVEERWRGRVLLLWHRELDRLRGYPAVSVQRTSHEICAPDAAVLIVPLEAELPRSLVQTARRRAFPILSARGSMATARSSVKSWLEGRLGMETTVHGVLMEVSGVGVLILGPSGIGKSESALDLVTRGHRLIADDLVVIRRLEDGSLMGRGVDMSGSHMEIRGLGIINIRDLFGVASVLESKPLELVVDLIEWSSLEGVDRLGLEEQHYDLLGVRFPYLRIPVYHGRNMAAILEVAARNHLLKKKGCFAARDFDHALSRRLASGRKGC